MKKEALDSSILASKSMKKSSDPLPDLETFRASRSKTKSSVKTRRGYSLHCWLPADEPTPVRSSNGLSVLGCAIVPELKPRARTMSERDLTRAYTPRHFLRS
ncbi:uncharacterized protein LOC114350950 [Ostrinia furnacalis]|uniref:uncharacterized protein LOC114350950 n=1 Tax=Ostrinia furnacalis TaxID=93504 RepID=UPI00103A3241|nr:uncharacterized protein LOC114350950 [Ostrinia furnacalis]